MISLDLLHRLLISLTGSLIAYVSCNALHIAHTLNSGVHDFNLAEVLSESLAHVLAVEVGFLVAHACAL